MVVFGLHGLAARSAITALAIGLLAGGWDATTAARAQHQMAPWCAYLGSWGGSYDCSYYSFRQCMATASGLGDICLRNPRYVGPPPRSPRRVRGYY